MSTLAKILNPKEEAEIGYEVSIIPEKSNSHETYYLVRKTHAGIAEDIRYTLRVDRHAGFVSCSCPGYHYRGKCKHVTYLKS